MPKLRVFRLALGLMLWWMLPPVWSGYARAQTPAGLASPGEPALITVREFMDHARSWGEATRVKLRGVVTHSTSDKTFFIQESGAGTYVFHRPETALAPGDLVEVIGNPSLGGIVPTLQNCSVKVVGRAPVPDPIRLSAREMGATTNDMKLATLRGWLEPQRLANGRNLILRTDNNDTFVVEAEALPDIEPLNQIPPGCLLDATGIVTHRTGPDKKSAGVRLLIRSANDLVILKGPPFWTGKRLGEVAAGSALALVLATAWIVMLRREVRKQTALISQRLEREAALRASEDRFLKVFNAAPDPMLIVRGADERILDINPAFERVTGHSRAEALGRSSSELGLCADDEFRREAVARFREGKPVVNLQLQGRRKTGEPLLVLLSMEWIELNGEKCWLSVVRDITEQRQAEEQQRRLEAMLLHSQKLEALGTLAGGIAHDFNNILAAILSNADLARASDGKTREHLDEIQSSAMRGRGLVNQILVFSRQQRQERQRVRLDSTVAEAARLLRAVTPGSIRIETRVSPNCPAVLADAGAILQVIVNLGTNGCHAMENRPGTLGIQLEPATVDAAFAARHPKLAPGEYLRLTVSDEGEGMDAETIRKIFDPFFTTKAPGRGTGLGLAITQSTVIEHCGVILVESTLGAGSVFSVYLPALPATSSTTSEPARPRAPEAPKGTGEKILLVDDDPALGTAMKKILEKLGYQVTATNDPFDALKRLESTPTPCQLLLTDLNMPGMSGLELIRQLRQTNTSLPIILLSGYITEDQRASILEDPAAQVLQKPATQAELTQAIRQALTPA
ncbi:MAG TPA: response regulator [Verrucomicrobiae bacterium]|nr:response regulator [Verrucomicrobiae bacterium]